MNSKHDVMSDKIRRDIEVLAEFIEIYCAENHGTAVRMEISGTGHVAEFLAGRKPALCRECGKLFLHGASKRIICPYDPKPRCKKCKTRCYLAGYREKIREVMRFSGMHLIKRGRIDLLKKYFF